MLTLSELPFVENIEEITEGKKFEFMINDGKEISSTLQRIVAKEMPILEFYLKEQGVINPKKNRLNTVQKPLIMADYYFLAD